VPLTGFKVWTLIRTYVLYVPWLLSALTPGLCTHASLLDSVAVSCIQMRFEGRSLLWGAAMGVCIIWMYLMLEQSAIVCKDHLWDCVWAT
jgi:hypothetical protein